MENKYGHPEFENLLKEEENLYCFDCHRKPAEWASVNNGIYLCITCSGIHRGFGVDISYMRSITLDNWNEKQISLMKSGGNKKCEDLLKKYNIDKTKIKNKQTLYESKIMKYYRQLLKNLSKGIIDYNLTPPSKESVSSLVNIDNEYKNNKETKIESNKKENTFNESLDYISRLNKTNFNENKTEDKNERFCSVGCKMEENQIDKEDTFEDVLGGFLNKAYNGGKILAQKVGELEIGNKLKGAGEQIITKGSEIAQSETVQNFSKSANDSLNMLFDKLFKYKNEETKPEARDIEIKDKNTKTNEEEKKEEK
ncbi:MAG: hypothetical protein MJ252_22060 [archaeon]|nr:hypothetical protein [archaeon]